jgi:two-component system alkaline phosphatase synthesis response regulator PhoP
MAKKIMVVDDEPDILESAAALLKSEGFEVVTAADGYECLKKLDGGVKPDLILMDYFMPGMTGRETVEKIRKNPQTKNLKIAFLTVAGFKGKGMQMLEELEVADYIQKPIEIGDFSARIKKLV